MEKTVLITFHSLLRHLLVSTTTLLTISLSIIMLYWFFTEGGI